MLGKILGGIKAYLTDWKNLLTHTLVGVMILAIAVYAPVSPTSGWVLLDALWVSTL